MRGWWVLPVLGLACARAPGSPAGTDPGEPVLDTSARPTADTAASPPDTEAPPPTADTGPPPTPWDAQLVWRWSGGPGARPRHVLAAPVVAQLTDDDGDGRVDARDVPDVVVSAFCVDPRCGGLQTQVVALEPLTGRVHWRVRDDTEPASQVAAGDLDGDGLPEVVYGARDGRVVAVGGADGTPRWRSHELVVARADRADAISLIDLGRDGALEVLVGGAVLSGATGDRQLTLGLGSAHDGRVLPVVADLDDDGVDELLIGGRVFGEDGRLRFGVGLLTRDPVWITSLPVQADADADAEVAVLSDAELVVVDLDVTELHRVPLSRRAGGAPCVADFDGDGRSELAFGALGPPGSTRGELTLVELDGAEVWRVTVGLAGGVAGCTVVDLDGDGLPEVAWAGDGGGVFDGRTGAHLVDTGATGLGLTAVGPVWADLDGDGAVELLTGGNAHDAASPGVPGLLVHRHPTGAWPAGGAWPTAAFSDGRWDPGGGARPTPIAPWPDRYPGRSGP